MKRTFTLALSIVTVIFLLAGLGAVDAFASSRLIMSRWAGPHADDQKAVVAEYGAANIAMDDIDYGNLKQKQIQSLSLTGEYDLVWVQEVWLPEYAAKGWLLPLNEFVQEANLDLSIYSAGMLEANTIDGELYALPTFAQTFILTYNTEWFDKENQQVPTTVEELIAVAKHFKEQGTGIALPLTQGQALVDLYAQFLYSAGGDYYDANGDFNMRNEKAVYAAELLQELAAYAMDGALTWHHDQVSEAIRTEKAPFGITITGLSGMDIDPNQSLIVDKVGYATVPGKEGVVGLVSYWSWAVAANGKAPKDAFDFAAWLCSPEVEKKQALMNGQITAVSSLAADPEVVASIPFLPVANETLARAKTQPTDEGVLAYLDSIEAAVSEIVSTNKTPAAVFDELQAALERR